MVSSPTGPPARIGRPRRDPATGAGGDAGDILLGWILRIGIVLAVVAVAGFDTVSTIQAGVTVSDQAQSAATAGQTSYGQVRNVQSAYQAALADAKASNPDDTIAPAQFSVSPTGVVTLRLDRKVHTLVAHYLPIQATKMVSATATAIPATS